MIQILKYIIFLICLNYGHTARDSNGVFIRKNAKDMSQKEWNSFKRGIHVLMKRGDENPFDPTGYAYQTNIHGYPLIKEHPEYFDKYNWHQCQHGQYFFLPWHRMYLYYFERILREASGDSDLTLPYWDYYDHDNRMIPKEFRNSDPNNPLYVNRCHDMNAGRKLPKELVNHKPTLSMLNFAQEENTCIGVRDFGSAKTDEPKFDANGTGALEDLPHNQIHLYVGGYLSDPCVSPRDPIFWLHHSQIDRIWETWLQLKGRNVPYNDTHWMQQEFHWYDTDKKMTTKRVSEAIDAVTQLNYRYDELTEIPHKSEKSKKKFTNPTITLIGNFDKHQPSVVTPLEIIHMNLKVQHKGADLLRKISSNQIREENTRILLQLNMSFVNTYKVIYDIYINSPILNVYTQKEPYYFRPLAVFQICDEEMSMNDPISRCYDVTSNIFRIFNHHYSGPFIVNLTFVPLVCDKKLKAKMHTQIAFNRITLISKVENENSVHN